MHVRSVVTALLLSASSFAAETPAIQLSPAIVDVRAGSTRTFSVSVSGGVQIQNLKWTLKSAGAATALGSFDPGSKSYTAPALPPAPNTVILQAQDSANAAVIAKATINVLNPIPAITALEPSTVNAGLPYSVLIKGTGFVPGSQVQWDGKTVPSTPDSASGGLKIAGGAAPAAGSAQITVLNPDPGSRASNARTLSITQVQVQASPDGRTVRAGGTLNLSAKVLNNADQRVTWTVNLGHGSVDSGGVYHAPDVVSDGSPAIVTATSMADSKASANLTINLLNVVPSISALTPSTINTGLAYSVKIAGTGILSGAQVKFGDTAVLSTFDAATGSLTVAGTAPAVGSIPVTVTNPNSGGTASNARTLNVLAPIQVQVTPDNRTVRCGTTLNLSAKVVNNPDQSVTWKLTGAGSVDKNGVYTAPAVLPDPPASTDVTVSAASTIDPKATASVTIHLANPTPVISAVSPKPLMAGTNGLTIDGTGFAKGAYIYYAGARMDTTWVSDKQLTTTSRIFGVPGGMASIKVSNPNPGTLVSAPVIVPVSLASSAETKMTYSDAVRFLQLATWGPTPDSIAELMKLGVNAWLAKQFATQPTPYPAPNDTGEGVGRLQDAFFTNALTGQDQLRQRVAFALSQIIVVSATKDTRFAQMAPYMTLLSNNAFGKFRPLMEAVTKNPSMGYFLDMVNNDKANPARNTVANENYARELLQLFTLGLVMLNPDGTPQLNSSPVYDESTVKDLAKVMTGWTYAPQPNFASKWTNSPWYFDPMTAFEEHHDTTDKTLNFTGGKCTIAKGGSAQSDLTAALDCIYKHPNLAPFISYRLIQRLVTSNPSPKYVKAVADVFVKSDGDLQQVVAAILTDDEASKPLKLNEPVLFATGLLRSLNATVTNSATGLRGRTEDMGQNVLAAPSVFNYFSPFFRAGAPPAPAPEFQIVNAATDLGRLNFVNTVVNNGVSGNVKVDLSNWDDLSADANMLIEALNQALHRGQMTAEEKSALKAAIGNAKTARAIVKNALYVAAAAPQYQVQQ